MWTFNPLTLATLASLTLLTPTLALDSWYTPPGGPPTGSGFNSTLNPSSTKIKGVNLGGWLILENWMTPSIFGVAGLPGKGDEDSVMDEWGLCERLGKARCEEVLEEHWESFYTEDDFKRYVHVDIIVTLHRCITMRTDN
jgi:glucan 1,3-beta-glucosidase